MASPAALAVPLMYIVISEAADPQSIGVAPDGQGVGTISQNIGIAPDV